MSRRRRTVTARTGDGGGSSADATAAGAPAAPGSPRGGSSSPSRSIGAPSIRAAYVAHPAGAAGFYAEQGASYRNPHEVGIRAAIARFAPRLPAGRILDLACGSGEVTLALIDAGVDPSRIDATDPYTGAAYRERVGARLGELRRADERGGRAGERGDLRGQVVEPIDVQVADWSFEQAPERLHDPAIRYGAVICSFALHLCPRSRLPSVALALARCAHTLLVLTPHKRPEIDPRWGWALEDEHYDPAHRVRARLYRSGAPR